MTIFYIADFKIDMSRSVIVNKGSETQVEPKVLNVLLLLAERQNEVVTHQELKDNVWQGTEVVPNALQRCIAILRKLFDDDAKSPQFIATHPKIGYRLITPVIWSGSALNDAQSVSVVKAAGKSQRANMQIITVLVLVIFVLLFAGTIGKWWSEGLPKQYTKVETLTHTDGHETHAIFSPNAKHIVFNRFAGECKSHLWAKNMLSGKEYQLTKESGYFGAVSYTADGRELVFAANKQCVRTPKEVKKKIETDRCWSIATLDFADALAKPQQPNYRYQCQADNLLTPKALSHHQYAFLQYDNYKYRLMRLNDLNEQVSVIFALEDEFLYHFDYSAKTKQFVVISRTHNFEHAIRVLDENGQVLTLNTLKLSRGMSANQQFPVHFEPDAKYLLATSQNSLYKIEFTGQLQKISTPEANLISVVKHPDNEQLLAVQGHKDIDIVQIALGTPEVNSLSSGLNQRTLPYNSLARTLAQERHALYQPNGDIIGFISDRSGYDDIWLWQNGEAQPFTQRKSAQPIHQFAWLLNGNGIAWVADDKLVVGDLSGDRREHQADMPLYAVLAVYQENRYLVTINYPTPSSLYLYDVDNNTLQALGADHVSAAWTYQDKLFYSEFDGEVFSGDINKALVSTQLGKDFNYQPMAKLNGLALFVHDAHIYSVDKTSLMLERYDFNGQWQQSVMSLKGNAWKVTGMRNKQLLLSQFIAINQDITLLN